MKLYNPFKNWYNPFKPHIVHTTDDYYVLRSIQISQLGWVYFDFSDNEWNNVIFHGSRCKTETELREKYAAIEVKEKKKEVVIKL